MFTVFFGVAGGVRKRLSASSSSGKLRDRRDDKFGTALQKHCRRRPGSRHRRPGSRHRCLGSRRRLSSRLHRLGSCCLLGSRRLLLAHNITMQ